MTLDERFQTIKNELDKSDLTDVKSFLSTTNTLLQDIHKVKEQVKFVPLYFPIPGAEDQFEEISILEERYKKLVFHCETLLSTKWSN